MNYLRQSGKLQFGEDTIVKNAQKIAMIMHKDLLLMKFFEKKPQIKVEI